MNSTDNLSAFGAPGIAPRWTSSAKEGRKADGGAFDGAGVGRVWPLLTGERGHHEIAAGRSASAHIAALEKFANAGGMLSEQLWDRDEPDGGFKRGVPTGAAMPLCWWHAEYVTLVCSAHDGVCFDRVAPALVRYVADPVRYRHEIWSFRHRIHLARGKILRLVLEADAAVVWTASDWRATHRTSVHHCRPLDLWFADLPTDECHAGTFIEFTFFWTAAQRWEGQNFSVVVSESVHWAADHAAAQSPCRSDRADAFLPLPCPCFAPTEPAPDRSATPVRAAVSAAVATHQATLSWKPNLSPVR